MRSVYDTQFHFQVQPNPMSAECRFFSNQPWRGNYLLDTVWCNTGLWFCMRKNYAAMQEGYVYLMESFECITVTSHRDGFVLNHQPLDSLPSRMFRLTSQNKSKVCITCLFWEHRRLALVSPREGPVKRKAYPRHDVIMGSNCLL